MIIQVRGRRHICNWIAARLGVLIGCLENLLQLPFGEVFEKYALSDFLVSTTHRQIETGDPWRFGERGVRFVCCSNSPLVK